MHHPFFERDEPSFMSLLGIGLIHLRFLHGIAIDDVPRHTPAMEGRRDILQSTRARQYGPKEIGPLHKSTAPAKSAQRSQLWARRRSPYGSWCSATANLMGATGILPVPSAGEHRRNAIGTQHIILSEVQEAKFKRSEVQDIHKLRPIDACKHTSYELRGADYRTPPFPHAAPKTEPRP